MNAPLLKETREEGVLTLWLNRPEKRNALNGALVTALAHSLARAGEEEGVRVVVLRGEGPDFCAGADLEELEGMLSVSREENLADARRLGDLLLLIRSLPKPILAAVHGRALAGGCGLATACDLILAREDAEFGYPEVHLGFVPAMVMAVLRRKLTEGRAFELVALGERIPATEAYRLGLVNRILGVGEFEKGVQELADGLARVPASALALTKSLLYEQAELSVAEGVERGAEVNVQARGTKACREGVRAFLARKKPGGG
jgi:methylglutaconyl-CoA hydratase